MTNLNKSKVIAVCIVLIVIVRAYQYYEETKIPEMIPFNAITAPMPVVEDYIPQAEPIDPIQQHGGAITVICDEELFVTYIPAGVPIEDYKKAYCELYEEGVIPAPSE